MSSISVDPRKGVVPSIITLCQAWKEQLAKDRAKIREPLRVVLMKALLEMLHMRHQQIVRGEIPLPPLLLDPETKAYQELAWDQSKSQLVPLHGGQKGITGAVDSVAQKCSIIDHSGGSGAAEGVASAWRTEQRGHAPHATHVISHEREWQTSLCAFSITDELQLLATSGCHSASGTGDARTRSLQEQHRELEGHG